MFKPAKLPPITIYQGATFLYNAEWRAGGALVDLTGCTARMQVRSEVESPTVLLNLTTENGGITLGGLAGTINLFISDADTSAIDWDDGVFDIEIAFPNGHVYRMAYGRISVSPEVTR